MGVRDTEIRIFYYLMREGPLHPVSVVDFGAYRGRLEGSCVLSRRVKVCFVEVPSRFSGKSTPYRGRLEKLLYKPLLFVRLGKHELSPL